MLDEKPKKEPCKTSVADPDDFCPDPTFQIG
jgi:hypothetical protein